MRPPCERFNGSVADLQLTRRSITFNFPFSASPGGGVLPPLLRPYLQGFGALNETGQAALRQALEQHWSAHNQSQNGVTWVESEYLEVVAIRAS
jgi:hypothetical protein